MWKSFSGIWLWLLCLLTHNDGSERATTDGGRSLFALGAGAAGVGTCQNNEINITACGEISGWVTLSFDCNCTFDGAANIGGWNTVADPGYSFISEVWKAPAQWTYPLTNKDVMKEYHTKVLVRAIRSEDGKTRDAFLRRLHLGAFKPYTMMNPNTEGKNISGEFSFGTDYNINNDGGHFAISPGEKLYMSGALEVPLIIDMLPSFTATHAGCTIVFTNTNKSCPIVDQYDVM